MIPERYRSHTDKTIVMVLPKWRASMVKKYNASPPTNKWTWATNRNTARLLSAEMSYLGDPEMRKDANVYIITINNSHDGGADEEISLVRELRGNGAKVVASCSEDSRFCSGIGLILDESSGKLFTDTLGEADIILSGIPEWIKPYGRYQHKVVYVGSFLDVVNLAIPYRKRNIDILVAPEKEESGRNGLNAEFLLLLLEQFPDSKICYCIRSSDRPPILDRLARGGVEISSLPLRKLIPRARVMVDLTFRPHSGRSLAEAWYYRTPFVSHIWSYYSRLFPEYSFGAFNMNEIADSCRTIINTNYEHIIRDAEAIAAEEYYYIARHKMMSRLYGECEK